MKILKVARCTLAEWMEQGMAIAHEIDRVEFTDREPRRVHPVESPFPGSAWVWDDPVGSESPAYRTKGKAMDAMSTAMIAYMRKEATA